MILRRKKSYLASLFVHIHFKRGSRFFFQDSSAIKLKTLCGVVVLDGLVKKNLLREHANRVHYTRPQSHWSKLVQREKSVWRGQGLTQTLATLVETQQTTLALHCRWF